VSVARIDPEIGSHAVITSKNSRLRVK